MGTEEQEVGAEGTGEEVEEFEDELAEKREGKKMRDFCFHIDFFELGEEKEEEGLARGAGGEEERRRRRGE
jgi:hypothetical protein